MGTGGLAFGYIESLIPAWAWNLRLSLICRHFDLSFNPWPSASTMDHGLHVQSSFSECWRPVSGCRGSLHRARSFCQSEKLLPGLATVLKQALAAGHLPSPLCISTSPSPPLIRTHPTNSLFDLSHLQIRSRSEELGLGLWGHFSHCHPPHPSVPRSHGASSSVTSRETVERSCSPSHAYTVSFSLPPPILPLPLPSPLHPSLCPSRSG